MRDISFAILGNWETILLLMVMLVMAAMAGVVIFLIAKSASRKSEPPQYPQPTSPPPGSKCPRCGATLTASAPQGLCPRCVFEIGMGTQVAEAPPAEKAKAPLPEELASHFPQFEILELLGQGGMGAVYKARQKDLDRVVALKVLPADGGRDPAFAERFTREARAMAKLSHPNIVTVHEFGQVGQASSLSAVEKQTARMPVPLYFFVMEFVDGANLRQTLQAQRLSPREAMAIVPQICEALQYAHDQGIVHRDIKPENVLLDKQGRVKIADFGLAKLLGKDPLGARLTRSAEVMGTPHYMAPEQLEKPLEVDHRADIYSLGVVFYEMLTGELPLGRFAPPSRKVQMDVRLDDVVLRALEKEPELRYQQASQFKTQVETIASGGASQPAPSRMAPNSVGKRLVIAGAVGAITFLVLVAVASFFAFNGPKTSVTSTAVISIKFERKTTDQERLRDQALEFILSDTVGVVASNLNSKAWWIDQRGARLDHARIVRLLRKGLRVVSLPQGFTFRIHYSSEYEEEALLTANQVALVSCVEAAQINAEAVLVQHAEITARRTKINGGTILLFGVALALLLASASGLITFVIATRRAR